MSKRILTVGLTPADQHVLLFDRLEIDNVNRAAENFWTLSGKSVNVAVGIETLCRDSKNILLTPLGGDRFSRFQSELFQLGVEARLVQSQTPTRTCTTLIDRQNKTITELVENSAPLAESELEQFASLFQKYVESAEILVLTGTLPKGCPADFYRRLLTESSPPKDESPRRILCDLQGEVLLETLTREDAGLFLVKPNRFELESTLKRTLPSETELIEGMRELNRLGAEWTLITDGSQAVWLTSRDEVYRFDPIHLEPGEIVNPIGCGDAMTAALAWSLGRDDSILDAVRQGIAASTVNLKQLLPCRLNAEEVVELSQNVRYEKR